MKKISSCLILTALILSACGPNVPAAAVANSGIIATWREDRQVTILYQKSSTSQIQLRTEANGVCAKNGWKAGPSKEVSVKGAKGIPGVDGRVVFQCI